MDSSWSKSRNLERSFIVRIHCFVSLKSFPSGSILGKLIERVYSLRITPIYSLMHVMVADWYQRIAPRYNWVFQQKKIKSIVHSLCPLWHICFALNMQRIAKGSMLRIRVYIFLLKWHVLLKKQKWHEGVCWNSYKESVCCKLSKFSQWHSSSTAFYFNGLFIETKT